MKHFLLKGKLIDRYEIIVVLHTQHQFIPIYYSSYLGVPIVMVAKCGPTEFVSHSLFFLPGYHCLFSVVR